MVSTSHSERIPAKHKSLAFPRQIHTTLCARRESFQQFRIPSHPLQYSKHRGPHPRDYFSAIHCIPQLQAGSRSGHDRASRAVRHQRVHLESLCRPQANELRVQHIAIPSTATNLPSSLPRYAPRDFCACLPDSTSIMKSSLRFCDSLGTLSLEARFASSLTHLCPTPCAADLHRKFCRCIPTSLAASYPGIRSWWLT